MKLASRQQMLRRIREIVARDTGQALSEAAGSEVERVLRQLDTEVFPSVLGQDFLSRDVTVLIADLRGFTAITAGHPPGVVIGLLNPWLIKMSEIIARHQGTIDKFMGDSIMVLFGAPVGREDDVRRALACAVEMQIAMGALNSEQMNRGMPELFMGIGINTGEVLAGLLGSDRYSEYTVIGDQVNLAARIEAFSLRGQILISESTYGRCMAFIETSSAMNIHVKGKPQPLSLREVVAIPSLGLKVPRQENRRSHRVKVARPLSYQRILGGIVLPAQHHGTICDLGYHGVLIELDEDLPNYAEIKLCFDLPLVEYQARDVYAKVVACNGRDSRFLLGVEFTSMPPEANQKIQLFVQLQVFNNRQ